MQAALAGNGHLTKSLPVLNFKKRDSRDDATEVQTTSGLKAETALERYTTVHCLKIKAQRLCSVSTDSWAL